MPSTDAGNLLTNGSDNKLYLPPSALDPEIFSVRLRSFNAIGNPNFEVDQRNAANPLTNPATSVGLCDRWFLAKAGTMTVNTGQASTGSGSVVPGTNFRISSQSLSVNLTGQQASLGVNDFFHINQTVEGSNLRELVNDVHSLSLFVFSTVAGLKFATTLFDGTRSLTKLCTIPVASTWTLIQLPNLPVWQGSPVITPGGVGYYIRICLASGANLMSPAADVWQTGTYVGAPGMDNFFSKPVNSLFYLGFVQHEPGVVCSQLMDKPFTGANGNLDECLRYYAKSWAYGTAIGTAGPAGSCSFSGANSYGSVFGTLRFRKGMAKTPSFLAYDPGNGAASGAYGSDGTHYSVSSVDVTSEGMESFSISPSLSATGAGQGVRFHYTADTGW
jgi:hypothetical protein